jgi:diacylglycerol kinase family enzyme
MSFKKIIIIYNPNSTGDSEKNAESFAEELRKISLAADIQLIATKFAAHAEEIAATYSGDESTLIVSSSGDGGYNEVINGVLHENGKAATAVLPSGNANDHHNAVSSGNLIEHIVSGQTNTIDVLKIVGTKNHTSWARYAHSYIGFGLTPKIGRALTENRPNVVTEKWHVLRHLLAFTYVPLIIDGKKRKFSSLVFATVGRMSKVIKLDEQAEMNDGRMEVYESDYRSLVGLVGLLLHASLNGISRTTSTKRFELITKRQTPVQLDGEVFTLDGGEVVVTCEHAKLRTVA